MRVLVYSRRMDSVRALQAVAELRSDGHAASWRDTKDYRGEVEPCDAVVTDVERVRAAFAAKGVKVVPLTAPADLPPAPVDLPPPLPVEGGDPISALILAEPAAPEPPADPPTPVDVPATSRFSGYRVDRVGAASMPWYRLIGPDGKKVGKSQRSEAEAWALLEA